MGPAEVARCDVSELFLACSVPNLDAVGDSIDVDIFILEIDSNCRSCRVEDILTESKHDLRLADGAISNHDDFQDGGTGRHRFVTFLTSLNVSGMGEVPCIAFDQRTENVGVAIASGFIIFDTGTGRVTYEATFPKGGASIVALLSNSNIVAAAGDGTPNGFYKNMAILWDKTTDSIACIYDFDEPILEITFLSGCLLVVRNDVVAFCSITESKPLYQVMVYRGRPRSISIVESVSSCLVCLPDQSGNALNIVDYRDPIFLLGRVPVACNRVGATAFTRQGNMLAVVVDEAKLILLYSLTPQVELVARFRRGWRGSEVTGIGFDSLGKMMLMTTTRGSVHIFAVPTPTEMANLASGDAVRAKVVYESDMKAQFDYAGFEVVGVTNATEPQKLSLQKLRIDMQTMTAVPLEPIPLLAH